MDCANLWAGNTIIIPEPLSEAYKSVLDVHGLSAEARGVRPDDPPVGGHTQEQTDLHFCHAFDGSVARVELVLLDPTGTMSGPASLLRRFLAGGSLCLVDVPTGAGAGALSLLTTIAALREQQVLPRSPLNVRLIWGEISVPALAYAEELLAQVNASLQCQAIFVTYEKTSWDVLDSVSNVSLVEKIVLAKATHPQVLLVICNFSGFLERQGKWKAANPGLSMLLQFCSGDLNGGVWIEPDQAAVAKGLFQKVGALFAKLVRFGSLTGDDPEGVACSARFRCPLKPEQTYRVNARALPIQLALQRSVK